METAGSNLVESIMKFLTRKDKGQQELKREELSCWLEKDMGIKSESHCNDDNAKNKLRY